VSRHVIQMDFDKANPLTLLGLGFLAIALTAGYSIYRRIELKQPSDNTSAGNN